MELIAQIALGVIIGGLTIALLVTGFFVWNSRQRNERLSPCSNVIVILSAFMRSAMNLPANSGSFIAASTTAIGFFWFFPESIHAIPFAG
jgi:hypothetical protein